MPNTRKQLIKYMCLLIESVRLEEGTFHNLRYHQRRVEDSFRALFGTKQPHDLRRVLESTPRPGKGLYKCRIIYDDNSVDVSFVPYARKPIRTLKVVINDEIEYPHKLKDRTALDNSYAMRDECDDILIVRTGEVTDSSFANIIFRKAGRWYTPLRPLLPGTMRQSLLENGKIQAAAIRMEHIRTFETFRLINAMRGIDSPEERVGNIIL